MYNKYELSVDGLYYLASPYSHENPFVRHIRYEIINAIAAQLASQGFLLLEPIASCHNKSLLYKLPAGYEFWKNRDRRLISRSDGIIVVIMPGWQESVGVTDEIEFATSLGLPVHYLNPKDILDPEVWNAIHY